METLSESAGEEVRLLTHVTTAVGRNSLSQAIYPAMDGSEWWVKKMKQSIDNLLLC